MEAVGKNLPSVGKGIDGSDRANKSARSRRRYRGAGFWLDWAPMIMLGLAIAISGVHSIGTSVFSPRETATAAAQPHRQVMEAAGSKAPHNLPGAPTGERTAF